MNTEKVQKIVLSFLTLIFAPLLSANNLSITELKDGTSEYNLSQKAGFLEDKQGKLSIKEILSDNFKGQFKKSPKGKANFSITSSTIWGRFLVKNNSPKKDWYFVIEYPALQNVTLYIIKDKKIISTKESGHAVSIDKKDTNSRNLVYKLNLDAEETHQIYFKAKSISTMLLPLKIYSVEKFLNISTNDSYVFGLSFGALIILFFYNLFIFIYAKDKTYIFYIAYLISITLYLSSLFGFDSMYFGGSLSRKALYIGLFFANFSMIFLTYFCQSLLKTKELNYKINYSFPIIRSFYFIAILLLPIAPHIANRISAVLLLPLAVSIFFFSIFAFIKGNKLAYFFLSGWCLHLIGIIIYSLQILSIYTGELNAANIVVFNATLEALLFSFALGHRINILKDEKNKIESESIKTKELLLHKEREKIFRDLHDHMGGSLLDTKIMLSSLSENLPKKSIVLIENIQQKVNMVLNVLRERIRFQENFRGLKEDFFGNLKIILLRRYVPAERIIHFHYNLELNKNMNLYFNEESLYELFSIFLEISNNDLKYGKGESNWMFEHLNDEIMFIFFSETSYEPGNHKAGRGSSEIISTIAKINGEIKQNIDENKIGIHVKIPFKIKNKRSVHN
ncbi:MAG: histidine kinase [Spirochaetia bacterium]|nr:histidine kinase [Spirochaetia bacterium]